MYFTSPATATAWASVNTGADAMAESGADYQTILTHYYTGVTVEVFNG
ncbi:MAG: hypothetical protein ACLU38_08040 [Dysosmobacter sp.]